MHSSSPLIEPIAGPTVGSVRDPIFDLIDAYGRPAERFTRAVIACDKVALGRPATEEEQAEARAAEQADDEALFAVLRARATTKAGLTAQLTLARQRWDGMMIDTEQSGVLDLLDTIQAFIDDQPSLPASETSDARLLALGAEHEILDRERTAFEARVAAGLEPDEDDAFYPRDWQLREAIDATPAQTLLGLAVKARAAEAAAQWDVEVDCLNTGSFVGLSRSLIRDVLAMSGDTEAVGPEADPIDVLFSEWLDTLDAQESLPSSPNNDDPNSESGRLYRKCCAIEEAIMNSPATPMRAAATSLIELNYEVLLSDPPTAVVRGHTDGPAWLALHILPCMLPFLTGRVASTVRSIVEHPDRRFGESDLFAYLARAAHRREPVLQAAE